MYARVKKAIKVVASTDIDLQTPDPGEEQEVQNG
jgi:hypothetical protein